MIKKEMIAMLLAGGQGSRLGVLTSKLAKPAVAFGGKYKIIDFPLSNCINSGVDTVGVLTQYRPLRLNQHIGIGIPWDLDRSIGGVTVLPPYEKSANSQWYTGTANAIYQNLEYIDYYNPDYVLILSGDHIYKMDYFKMLEFHKANNADCTIAVIDVPLSEASRFGIMSVYDDGKIYKFAEKPKNPDSTKASMGIYIFSRECLYRYLKADAEDPASENDFGKNIIPKMLGDNQKMIAYQFDGYWKDVGTISSLWEANMDILHGNSGLNLGDDKWKIYCRNTAEPPHYVSDTATISESLATEGAMIYGTVKNSVLFGSVTIGKGAYVEGAIIMPNAVIEEGADVRYSIVGWNAVVGKNAKVGETQPPSKAGEWKISVIAPNYKVKAGEIVTADKMIGG